jgi:hypothetical protein
MAVGREAVELSARDSHEGFLARFFLKVCARCHLDSALAIASFGTLNILRTALLMRSASVFPGT